jgi:hypothetical protein
MISQFGLRKEIYFSLDELNKRLKDFEDLQVGKDYSLYEFSNAQSLADYLLNLLNNQ